MKKTELHRPRQKKGMNEEYLPGDFIQIIPATVPVAAQFDEDGKIVDYPIVCWALISGNEPSDYREVVGLIFVGDLFELSTVNSGESKGTFIRYVYGHDYA